jgi:quinol monooxygenase YgiN
MSQISPAIDTPVIDTAIIVTAIFHPREGASEALIDAMRHTIPLVHEEEGCELYAINEEPDGTIVMIEKWSNAELLDAHGAGPVVADFNSAIADLIERPVRVTRLRAIPIGDITKGAL